jgi:hypothetical protein
MLQFLPSLLFTLPCKNIHQLLELLHCCAAGHQLLPAAQALMQLIQHRVCQLSVQTLLDTEPHSTGLLTACQSEVDVLNEAICWHAVVGTTTEVANQGKTTSSQ